MKHVINVRKTALEIVQVLHQNEVPIASMQFVFQEADMWDRLEKILKDMWDDHDFILGVKLHLPTEENKREMIHAIEMGWVTNPDEAVEYSMAIYQDEPFEE